MNSSSDELIEVAHAFERAYGAVWAAFHRAEDADGLGQLERQILHHVVGATSPTQIAAHLGLAKSTTTVVLQRLAAKGLVERTRSVDDERRVIVTRTPAGDGIVADDGFLHRAELTRALASLPAHTRTALIAGLEQLSQARDLDPQPPRPPDIDPAGHGPP